jgi:hypothetical protein
MREQLKPGVTMARYKEIEAQLDAFYEANPAGLFKNIFESNK